MAILAVISSPSKRRNSREASCSGTEVPEHAGTSCPGPETPNT